MVQIIVVEESPSESALMCIAIALRRPGTKVCEVRSVREAAALLQKPGAPPSLVILGWRALQRALRHCLDLIDARSAIVGFASDLGEAGPRALEAGVRQIYERPSDWKPYVESIENMLRDWVVPAAAQLRATQRG